MRSGATRAGVQTLREALRAVEARLAPSSTCPRLDAELLLTHALALPRHAAYAQPERTLDQQALASVEALVARCSAGEPMAQVLGQREFWSMAFEVTPATLVPRPETEHLVEQALLRLPVDVECAVLDAGTGTGAIAVAIANERPRALICAVDASGEALTVARGNADRLAPERIEFVLSDWFAALGQRRFALIVSNPPYVQAHDPALRSAPLSYEPRAALAAGPEGLDAIVHLASHASAHLEPAGWLLIEHGSDQGQRVRDLLEERGFSSVATVTDLAGHERVTAGRL
ncbi:MAG: peptide chain release factor N(5)-glutamine methyltransferase [Gammaproteobacteria bacterium]